MQVSQAIQSQSQAIQSQGQAIQQGVQQVAKGIQDIHDIKPPVPVGIDPLIFNVVLVIVGIFLFTLAAYLLFRYLKSRLNKKKKNNMLLLPPPLPADQAALRELDSISDLMMIEPRLYYFRLTALVKTFIGKVFNINAPEMTTQEIIAALNTIGIELNTIGIEKNTMEIEKKIKIEKNMITNAKEFFLSSSMIKYAAVTPEIEQIKSDEKFVKEFIESIFPESNGFCG